MKKLLYIVGGIILLIVFFVILSGGEKKETSEQQQEKTQTLEEKQKEALEKLLATENQSQQQQTVPTYRQQEQDIKAQAREYTIVDEEDLSIKALDKSLSSYTKEELAQLSLNIRMEYRIIVPSDIEKDELKATLIKVVKESVQENQDIDEVVVFAYDNESDIDGSYTFGRIEWCPNGDWAGVTSAIASSNNRSSYKYVFDIKDKVGEEEGKPTVRETEIYNLYWEKLNESGNPRGYVSHPTQYESGNTWEKARMDEIINDYDITIDEFNKILDKVFIWKLK